jgi:hypothetical protein
MSPLCKACVKFRAQRTRLFTRSAGKCSTIPMACGSSMKCHTLQNRYLIPEYGLIAWCCYHAIPWSSSIRRLIWRFSSGGYAQVSIGKSLVAITSLGQSISSEIVEKAQLTFLTPLSGVVSPFLSKRSSIVEQMVKPLFLAPHREICSGLFRQFQP